MPSANRPQCELLQLPHKYRAFVGGYGSGKTWVGGMDQCIFAWEHPKINQGYFAPTYAQIRDIFYPTIEEVAFDMGLNVEIKEGNKEVHFYCGKQYRSTTICRSMENPGSIIGFKIGNALVDELDLMNMRKGAQAWRKISARMRYVGLDLRNGILVTTTPEGFGITHKLFVADPQNSPQLRSRYGLVQASTYENEANLPDDYIPSLRETYTAELVEAYIDGKFCNLTSGTVYRNFNRIRNASNERIKPPVKIDGQMAGEPLFIGMDFNVMHMAATINVQRPNGWHAVAEIKDVFDTPDMIRIIQDRWQSKGHRIFVYPDATGKNRESVDASKSDLALLEQARFIVRTNPSNPAVKDRIHSVNKQFEKQTYWVNVKECPRVTSCLEQQAYDENGEPDKKSGFDHQNDATGYPIAYEFPIVHDRIQRISIGGS